MLAEDHALRLRVDAGTDVVVQAGEVTIGLIHGKPGGQVQPTVRRRKSTYGKGG
jgi:hypothetical protein